MHLIDWLIGLILTRPAPPSPPVPPVAPPTPPPDPDPSSNVMRCITAINAERRKTGRSNLGRDDRLDAAAQIQANDCARRDVLSHTGWNGSDEGERIALAGYNWSRCAENAGQQPLPPPGWPGSDPRTPEWIVDGWMQSPGHRANMLGPYTQVGAAYADAASGTRYWVAVFAVPSP